MGENAPRGGKEGGHFLLQKICSVNFAYSVLKESKSMAWHVKLQRDDSGALDCVFMWTLVLKHFVQAKDPC